MLALHPLLKKTLLGSLLASMGAGMLAPRADAGEKSLVGIISDGWKTKGHRRLSGKEKECSGPSCPDSVPSAEPTPPAQGATPPADAAAPPPAPETSQALDAALALSSSTDAAGASDTLSPNMFGDSFGSGRGSATVSPIIGTYHFVNPSADPTDRAVLGANNEPVRYFAGPDHLATTTIPLSQILAGNRLSAPLVSTPLFNSQAQTLVGPPGTQATVGSGTINAQSQGDILQPSGSFNILTLDVLFTFLGAPQTINLPTPGSGGVVGQTKVADDNSPLPRDRVIFNYDYFNNVPLTNNGWNVNRFSPGLEKTFFNRMTSIEVRFPFAGTLNSTITQGAESSNVQFGNVNVTFKGLLFRNNWLALASGMGVEIPTANDTVLQLPDGTQLIRIKNQAVYLKPYIAALWTPTPRLFAQTWGAFVFDPQGNPVQANLNLIGLQSIGKLNAQTLSQVDAQIGYWLYRNQTGCLQGLAPFLEMHYNATLGSADLVSAGSYNVGSTLSNFNEVNVSAGFVTQIYRNLIISTGAVAPLLTGTNRVFDYQVGVRANYFYGPTARERNASYLVSNF